MWREFLAARSPRKQISGPRSQSPRLWSRRCGIRRQIREGGQKSPTEARTRGMRNHSPFHRPDGRTLFRGPNDQALVVPGDFSGAFWPRVLTLHSHSPMSWRKRLAGSFPPSLTESGALRR